MYIYLSFTKIFINKTNESLKSLGENVTGQKDVVPKDVDGVTLDGGNG